MLGPIAIFLASMAAASTSTSALMNAPKNGEICISIRRLWQGSLEETTRIVEDPVPESYRREFGWTGCQHLAKETLIDWHLAFGNEQSTTQALDFLERSALEGAPSPAAFESQLSTIWKAAVKEEQRLKTTQGSSPYYKDKRRDWFHSRVVRRLREAVRVHSRFQFLATAYLRAANLFSSPALLAKGRSYLLPTVYGSHLFYDGRRISMSEAASSLEDAAGISEGGINKGRALEMSYATAQARISGSSDDIMSAVALIRENADQVMRDAAEPLIGRVGEFCNEESASETLRQACGEENDLPGRLRSFWLNAAMVELLTGADASPAPKTPFGSFDIAMKAIAATDQNTDRSSFLYTAQNDDMVMLLLAHAGRQPREPALPTTDAVEGYSSYYESMDDLVRAERLTPVALNPNRFRQIAERYLAFAKALAAETPVSQEVVRYSSYLQIVLANIESIRRNRLNPLDK